MLLKNIAFGNAHTVTLIITNFTSSLPTINTLVTIPGQYNGAVMYLL